MNSLTYILILTVILVPCLFSGMAHAGENPAYASERLDGTSMEMRDELPPSLLYDEMEYDWFAEKMRYLSEGASIGDTGSQAPFIMLAGYYDTDVTYVDGGNLKIIAYVMDPDGPEDIASVELYYETIPTGVYLLDNGASGDFGANDQIYGWQANLDPYSLPAGQYRLELIARDYAGNESDLWPYLTVHP